jgi:AcrR family transcriptional regulator
MAETRRDSLVDAAAGLLDQGGLAAVTLRAVGDAAGVSRNAPYRHFADKSDLLAAVASRELDQLAAAFRGDGLPGAKPNAREVMDAYVQWALRYPGRFRLTFGAWEGDQAELGAATHRAREVFVDAVRRAQAEGSMPKGNPARIAALLLSTAHGAADLTVSGHLGPPVEGRIGADELVDDLFAHLRAAAQHP